MGHHLPAFEIEIPQVAFTPSKRFKTAFVLPCMQDTLTDMDIKSMIIPR